jgi:hypothetical protein
VKKPDLLCMRPVERTDRLASGLQQNLAALLRAAIALTTPEPFVDQREGSPVASVGRNARKLVTPIFLADEGAPPPFTPT